MKHTLLISLLAMILFATNGFSAAPHDMESFRETATTLRKIWQEYRMATPFRPYTLPETQITEAIDMLRSLPKIGDNGATAFILSQYDTLTPHNAEELFLIFQEAIALSNVHLYPIGFHRDLTTADFLCWNENLHESIFPLRTVGRFHSGSVHMDIHWARNPFPNQEPLTFHPLSLAQMFSNLGLYDLAWRAQLERPFDMEMQDFPGTMVPIPYHFPAANDAYRAGRKELAWSLLMNAAVFDHEHFFEPAMTTAQLWLDIEAGIAELPEAEPPKTAFEQYEERRVATEIIPAAIPIGFEESAATVEAELPQPEITQEEKRKMLFLAIVNRYQHGTGNFFRGHDAMNAHPRAWRFIEEHKHEFDDPEELIKRVQEHWLENVVNRLRRNVFDGRLVLYGVQLVPDVGNDPLAIELPWAFPEGGIERLKVRLGRLAARAAGGFRMWGDFNMWRHFPETRGELIRARFISFADDTVTLEREDGSQMTVEFSQIRGEDQHYVRTRMAIEAFGEGFRTWHYYTGNRWVCNATGMEMEDIVSCVARFVSFVDDIVTLQLDDGSEMTLEFSQLRGDFLSQDYIRRRMEMAVSEVESVVPDSFDGPAFALQSIAEITPETQRQGSVFVLALTTLTILAILILCSFFIFRRFCF